MGTHRVYRERKYAFGQQLLMFRGRTTLTQTELAEQAGVHRRSVQNWEIGESYPRTNTLQRLIAVLLQHGGFRSGYEREEAYALWGLAERDTSNPIGSFDDVWFARTLIGDPRSGNGDQGLGLKEVQPPSLAASPQPPVPSPQSSLVDWGEAVAVPALYGRERELATLRQWVIDDRCRVITVVGLGGIGKSSLTITFARDVAPQFDIVLFRSLQNGPPLAELLDQVIHAISLQPAAPLNQVSDKITRLVQLFRERRCLLILDNFESIMQPGAISGTYRTGYSEYSTLLQSLSERTHQSCLILTSREKAAELGPREGSSAPVRSLRLAGLDNAASQRILAAKDISGTSADLHALTQLYAGNPLALNLVVEPIHELFNNDIGAFLAFGDVSFNSVGTLLDQQFARSTLLEQTILYQLAIEREPVSLDSLLANLGDAVQQRAYLITLASLGRRMLIERSPDRPAFMLQPVIHEYVTDQLVAVMYQELVDGLPWLLHRHALIQATAKDYVRRSQEHLIAKPLLERLVNTYADTAQQRLTALLANWRGRPHAEQGYGPGNTINLLRLLRGDLNRLDLSNLLIKHLYLQGVHAHAAILAGSQLVQAVFEEPFAGIEAIACTPDMRYLAVGTVNGEVRVWELATRTVRLAIHGHTSAVVGLALSANGRLLASASGDGTVRLWEVDTAKSLAVFEHPTLVHSVALAEDQQLLASAGGDGIVRLWDIPSGSCLATLEGHTQAVWSVALSADGRLLASGSFDGTARLWDLSLLRSQPQPPPRCLAVVQHHTAGVYSVALSADARVLATGGADRCVRVWDLSAVLAGSDHASACLATLAGHTDTVRSVVLSSDGHFVASGSGDGTVRLWDVHTHACVTLFEGHTSAVWGVAMSTEMQILASGSTDGTARLWEMRSGTALMTLHGHTNAVLSVALAPDGRLLASGGMDGTVQLWDVRDGTSLRTLYGHTNMVVGAACSPDGQLLATASADGTVRLWDVRSGVNVATLEGHSNVVRSVAWSADRRLLASGGYDRTIRLWDTAVALRHGGRTDAALTTLHGHTNMVMSVALAPDGRLLASGSYDQTIRLWDTSTATCLAVLEGHTSAVWGVALSADARLLASGSTDRTVRVWDVASGTCLAVLEGHTSAVMSVALSADGRLLASGSGDRTVRLWDVASGACLAVLEGHTSAIWSVVISANLIVSGSTDGATRVWDSVTAAPLRTLRPPRPYEGMDITGLTGIGDAQRASLLALGARERTGDRAEVTGTAEPALAIAALPAHDEPVANAGQNALIGLPFQPTSFIGRAAELSAIGRLLGESACRLLTLLGPGGIGKTRLAMTVAATHAAAFRDGVAFVELASVETSNQIVSAISNSLSLTFAGHADPTAQLFGALHERHMLLILDTFEHLLAHIDLVAALLAHAPHITILVTSRERLNLQHEWLFDVAGLSYPLEDPAAAATPHSLAALADYTAVQLFIQRAKQVQPKLLLPEAAVTAIIRICQHVAGMPLAIELAAVSVRTLPIAEIEQQIRANLDVLVTTYHDVPARHRSMRAVFDHSWRLLNEPERLLFSNLAVFRGGWTVEAAAAVVQSSEFKVQSSEPNTTKRLTQNAELRTLLAALVDKSLVRQSTIPTQSDRVILSATAEARFVLLEPIREYALEQLVARHAAMALQRAHADYYLALATEAAAQWHTAAVDSWIEQLHRENDNMRAALQWARDTSNHVLGLQLAGALWKFWQGYGYTSEGRAWLDQLLTLNDPHPDPTTMVARLSGLQAAAWLASDQHDDAQAMRLLDQRMLLRRMHRETTGDTNPLVNVARQARTEGQYQRATAALEAALARHTALRSHIRHGSAELGLALDDLGQVLRVLGLVCREQGSFAQAQALFAESLTMQRRFGDREGAAFSLIGLADVARDQADTARVREYAEESLAILRELRIQWMIGFALNTLAQAAYFDGDLAHARALIGESVTLFRGINAYSSLAEVLITQGHILRAQGYMAAAYSVLSESLRSAWAVGPRLFVAAALEGLATIDSGRGEAARTVQLLATASALRAHMGTPVRPVDQAAVDQALASARSALGDAFCAAMWATAQAQPPNQILSILPSATAFDERLDQSHP